MIWWETLRARMILLLFRPTLWWNRMLHRTSGRRWWDWVDDNILLGAIPYEAEVDQLRSLGIGAVINMCAEFKGCATRLVQHGIEQLWLPTPDFTPPRAEDLRKATEFIVARLREGKKVYIHCKAGRGRSAAVAFCYLVAVKRLTPEEAQLHLLQVRPHVHRRLTTRYSIRQFLADLAERPLSETLPLPAPSATEVAGSTEPEAAPDPPRTPSS